MGRQRSRGNRRQKIEKNRTEIPTTQRSARMSGAFNDLRTIQSNSKLNSFYAKRASELMAAGIEDRKKIIDTAVSDTKKFAKQNKIPWGF